MSDVTRSAEDAVRRYRERRDGLRMERHREEEPAAPLGMPSLDLPPVEPSEKPLLPHPEKPLLERIATTPSSLLEAVLSTEAPPSEAAPSLLERAVLRRKERFVDPREGSVAEQLVLDVPRTAVGVIVGIPQWLSASGNALLAAATGRKDVATAMAEILAIPGSIEAWNAVLADPALAARTPLSSLAAIAAPAFIMAGAARGAGVRTATTPLEEASVRRMAAEARVDLVDMQRRLADTAKREGLVDYKGEPTVELASPETQLAIERDMPLATVKGPFAGFEESTGRAYIRVGNRNVAVQADAIPKETKRGAPVEVPESAVADRLTAARAAAEVTPDLQFAEHPADQPSPLRPRVSEDALSPEAAVDAGLRTAEMRERIRTPPDGPRGGDGAGGGGSIEPVRPLPDLGIFQQAFGTPMNQWRRISPEAGALAEDLALTPLRIRRLNGKMDNDVAHILDPIRPKGLLARFTKEGRGRREFLRGTGERALVDVLDGAKREAIEARTDLTPPQKTAALALRDHLDVIRSKITDALRSIGFDVPDEWGLEGYFPHLFPGDFRVLVRNQDGAFRVLSDHKTTFEALRAARDFATEHNLTAKDIRVLRKNVFITPDVVRLGDRRFFGLMRDLADGIVERTGDETYIARDIVADALRGVVGRRRGRRKFSGHMLRRKGAQGFSRDVESVLQSYHRSVVRHIELTRLNREAQPVLEQLRKEGRTRLAADAEQLLGYVWGQQSRASSLIDSTLQQIPVLRDTSLGRGFAADRVLASARNWTAFGLLSTVRFGFLNSAQPFQTLWPTVTTREFLHGTRMFFTKEGQGILEKHGVPYDVSRWFERMGGPSRHTAAEGRLSRLRSIMRRFSPDAVSAEARNQGIAFLTWYEKGRKAGMDDAAAAKLATTKGQIYTQFLGSAGDNPGFSRGPFTKAIFQFRRFNIKNLELGWLMLADRNYPGHMKWLAAQGIVGGVRQLTRYAMIVRPALRLAARTVGAQEQVDKAMPADMPLRLYGIVKREFGEEAANMMMWGAPTLAGVDLSYSTQMLDLPFAETLPEAVGEILMGPLANVATQTAAAAASTEGPRYRSPAQRALLQAMRRVPALRFAEGLLMIGQRLAEGKSLEGNDYEFRTPGGRLQFQTDLRGVLLHLTGFRQASAAKQDLAIEGFTNLYADWSAAVTDVAQMANESLMATDPDEAAKWQKKAERRLTAWNELWGDEAPITSAAVSTRLVSRLKEADRTTLERFLANAPTALKPYLLKRGIEMTPEMLQALRDRLTPEEE